ncbi:MAG: transposase [Flavobacteriales bacterium]
MSNATFYQWKARYGGMEPSQVKQLRDLQEEHSRLKCMYTELSMVHDALKQVVEKKWGA